MPRNFVKMFTVLAWAGSILLRGGHSLKLGGKAQLSAGEVPMEDFAAWQKKWSQYRNGDEEFPADGPPDSSFKMVWAILTSLNDDRRVRDVHRQTWMKQPGVCSIVDAPKPGCVVYPVFAFGNLGKVRDVDGSILSGAMRRPTSHEEAVVPPKDWIELEQQGTITRHEQVGKATMEDVRKESEQNGDMIFLHGEPENMNDGKTYAWFKFAVDSFPWATHLGKLDTDTYPRVKRLLATVPPNNNTKFEEGKFIGTEKPYYQYLGGSSGALEGALKLAHKRWHGGAFYMFSQPLVKELVADKDGEKSFWSANLVGDEDAVTGRVVREFQSHLPTVPISCRALGIASMLMGKGSVDCAPDSYPSVAYEPYLDGTFVHIRNCWPEVEDVNMHCKGAPEFSIGPGVQEVMPMMAGKAAAKVAIIARGAADARWQRINNITNSSIDAAKTNETANTKEEPTN